jgi:predicted YcjX-like family ATPase
MLDEEGRDLFDSARAIQDRQPGIAAPDFIEELIQVRYSGLRDQEFFPVAEKWRSECPELVQRLEQRYQEYRKRIVEPLFATLTACDGLVVLVDIANILASGPRQLNDVHYFMDQILKALQPGGQILQALLGGLGIRRRIRRVAVAASQCDRFHPDDWNLLEKLAKQLWD